MDDSASKNKTKSNQTTLRGVLRTLRYRKSRRRTLRHRRNCCREIVVAVVVVFGAFGTCITTSFKSVLGFVKENPPDLRFRRHIAEIVLLLIVIDLYDVHIRKVIIQICCNFMNCLRFHSIDQKKTYNFIIYKIT
ncbi:hypothetical protein Hanom_Chr12g01177191 [Helianthus anomalus]